MTHWFEKIASLVWLRSLLACITIIGVGMLFYRSLFIVRTADTLPMIETVTPQKAQNFGPYVAAVDTGIYVRTFATFEVNTNTYTADAVVWFVFDPAEISLDSLAQFTCIKGTLTYKQLTDVHFIGKRLFAAYDIRAKLSPDLRFDYYPYDGHILPIVIAHPLLTPGELSLVSSSARCVIGETLVGSWRIHADEVMVRTGYVKSYLDNSDPTRKLSYPLVVYGLPFTWQGSKYILIMFIPLLLAMLLSLFALLVPYRYGKEMSIVWGLAVTSLTSLVAYRFVLQKIMPVVGYMTVADTLYTFALLLAFVPFCLQLLVSLMLRRTDYSVADEHELYELFNVVSLLLFMASAIATLLFLYYMV